MSPRKHAVLLLAHGSPDAADEVPEFMKHITAVNFHSFVNQPLKHVMMLFCTAILALF